VELDFYDFTYDGLVQDNYLKGGLGQLTDGDVGETNFRSVSYTVKPALATTCI
jgi:discoidin domain receptor family protein 2